MPQVSDTSWIFCSINIFLLFLLSSILLNMIMKCDKSSKKITKLYSYKTFI